MTPEVVRGAVLRVNHVLGQTERSYRFGQIADRIGVIRMTVRTEARTVPAGVTAAALAGLLAGAAGMVANVLLLLYLGLARPWEGWMTSYDWLGTANDSVLLVQFGALVLVAFALRARVAGRLAAWATAAGVAAMGGIVVLHVLLLAGVMEFDVQVWPVIGCIAVTFGWLLAMSRAGRSTLSRPVAGFGTVLGLTYLIALAVCAAAFLLPAGSLGHDVVLWLGISVGAVCWLGFPVWPLLWARHVMQEER